MKTKTQPAPKLSVCTKTVAESFAGFSDRNLKKVALTLLGMLAKRSDSRAELIVDAIRAVDPFTEFDGVMFVPAKRTSKKRVRKAA